MENNKHIFIDESGNKYKFEIIDTFKVEDTEYAVLQAEDNDEAILLRIEYDEEDNQVLVAIEDQDEFDEARDSYFELLDEEE